MSIGAVLFNIFMDLGVYWKTGVFVLTPILLLPLPLFLQSPEANCGYTLILMAVYWITDALPDAVTALIPLVLFPLLGIMPAPDVASLYIGDTSIVLIGGLIMALAIEKCQLHKRIGLGILVLVGTKPTRLLVGFMLPTWFLSLWINNAATTAMMMPIAEAVIVQLQQGISERRNEIGSMQSATIQILDKSTQRNPRSGTVHHASIDNESREITYSGRLSIGSSSASFNLKVELIPDSGSVVDAIPPNIILNDESSTVETTEEFNKKAKEDIDHEDVEETKLEENERIRKISRMLCLVCSYASTIGGTATLTGAPVNLIVSDAVSRIYASHGLESPLNYTSWLLFGLPHSVLCLVGVWAWLQLVFLGWKSFFCHCVKDQFSREDEGVRQALRSEYQNLGPISFGEISAIVFLILLVALWFARDPGFAPGYASLFKEGYVTDAVPAIFVSILLFVWPANKPNFLCFRVPEEKRATRTRALLDWQTVSTKLCWGPLILLGGGLALAAGCEESGLSAWIGDQMSTLNEIPTWATALIITILVSFMTEITTNVAVISLVLPILEAMSEDMGINPLYLMLSAGMAASYAFMLPIATPSNAIVFEYRHLKILNMASVGFVINIFCILVVTLGINTWGMALFNLNEIPWAEKNNSTGTTYFPVTS